MVPQGDPQVPRCGFSQQTVKILDDLKIDFTSFDILTDESIRQGSFFTSFSTFPSLSHQNVFFSIYILADELTGMKKLNSWPTFPQLIIKGELVGGLDILKEMIDKHGKEKSELDELLTDDGL